MRDLVGQLRALGYYEGCLAWSFAPLSHSPCQKGKCRRFRGCSGTSKCSLRCPVPSWDSTYQALQTSWAAVAKMIWHQACAGTERAAPASWWLPRIGRAGTYTHVPAVDFLTQPVVKCQGCSSTGTSEYGPDPILSLLQNWHVQSLSAAISSSLTYLP